MEFEENKFRQLVGRIVDEMNFANLIERENKRLGTDHVMPW